MSLATVNAASYGMELCVFDMRRGQREEEEIEKILFFFPPDLPFSTQLSFVGLCEGIITFTRIFSPETPCEVIQTQKHHHVFYEPEPDIWMVMIVEKGKNAKSVCTDSLMNCLKEIHSLFLLFYGSMRDVLEHEPSAEQFRAHLFSFILDYLSDFYVGKKLQLPSFRHCLMQRGTVQMLSVGREAALEVQSLVGVLENSAGTACQSLILFHDLLVSTTASHDDTVNLFTYAVLRLTPRALLSGTRASLSKGTSGTSRSAVPSPSSSHSGPGDSYHNRRPLQRGRWSKGKDGFLVLDVHGGDSGQTGFATPTILLLRSTERMYMCAYQYRNLTVLLLIPFLSVRDREKGVSSIVRRVFERALSNIVRVEDKLSRGWAGENAYHVSGCRYLLIDNGRHVSRASPPRKVMTLTKDSLLAMNELREEVNLEKRMAELDCPGNETELEMCTRTKNGAWVIAHVKRAQELYIVLEKANETLLYASAAAESFSDKYCGGFFSL